jgi:hypothetical protein
LDEYFAHALVKFEDGSEETLRVDNLDVRDSELERAFRLAVPEAMEKIDHKIAIASKALSEACEISEKYGIPFSSYISFLSQGYKPESFEEKYGDVNGDIVSSLTDNSNEYSGWQHSAVCY